MKLGLGLAVFVASLLVAAQIILPIVAEDRVRSELSATGRVTSVEVSAFPALKLLFGRADSVRVRMSRARIGSGDLGDRLASTKRVDSLDARVDTLTLGPLVVHDVTLRKRGSALTGSASVRSADLSAALPVDLGLRPVSSAGDGLVLEGSVGPISARARLSASDGALVIAPDGLLGGFATLTLFQDPRVRVLSVSSRGDADEFTLTARGTVH